MVIVKVPLQELEYKELMAMARAECRSVHDQLRWFFMRAVQEKRLVGNDPPSQAIDLIGEGQHEDAVAAI